MEMRRNISRKVVSVLLAITMVLTGFAVSAPVISDEVHATSRSQAEAVAWANARYYEGWCVDYDGVYGCQCVDLIKYYCDYLGDAHSSFTRGNAYSYATNALPAGWSRSSSPSAGDIFVCQPGKNGAGSNGHVGIVTEVRGTSVVIVETNAGGANGKCTVALGSAYNRTYIHPNFYTAPTPSTDGSEMPSGCDRTIPDGNYVIANASNPIYYLDIKGTTVPATNGTNVMLCKSDSVGNVIASDVWTVKYSGGFYTISQKGTSICLDVAGASVKEGANVQTCSSNGTSAQKWAISENGRNGFRIRAKCSGKSLDISDGNIASGTNIWQYTGNDSEAQSWVFIPYNFDRTIPDGDYVIANASNPLYYLDINGTSVPAANGSNVMLCKGDTVGDALASDVWTVKYSNGYYTITQKGTSISLDVAGASTKEGTNIQAHTSNGTVAQKWAISENGRNGFNIQSKCSGHALDVKGANLSYGTNIQQWACNNNDNQAWVFIPYQPRQTIADGDYVIVNASNPLYYLDINGTSIPATSGTNVMLYKSDSVGSVPKSDVWTLKYNNGYYTILQKGTEIALDVKGAYTKIATNVQAHSSNGTAAQQWAITGDSSNGYIIRAKCSGHSLDICNGNIASGENIQQYSCNNTKAQIWRFIPYSTAITSDMISSISEQNYTGKAVTPSVVVKYSGKTLTKDTDYTVSYKDNINAGTAQVIITGIGNYTGTVTKEFTIKKDESSNDNIIPSELPTATGSSYDCVKKGNYVYCGIGNKVLKVYLKNGKHPKLFTTGDIGYIYTNNLCYYDGCLYCAAITQIGDEYKVVKYCFSSKKKKVIFSCEYDDYGESYECFQSMAFIKGILYWNVEDEDGEEYCYAYNPKTGETATFSGQVKVKNKSCNVSGYKKIRTYKKEYWTGIFKLKKPNGKTIKLGTHSGF